MAKLTPPAIILPLAVVLSALVAFAALSPSSVRAASTEFSFCRVNIPDGWTATEEDNRILISNSPEQQPSGQALAPAMVAILTDSADGLTPRDLAAGLAMQVKGSPPVPFSEEKSDTYVTNFTNQNNELTQCLVTVKNGRALIIVSTGVTPELPVIINSIDLK